MAYFQSQYVIILQPVQPYIHTTQDKEIFLILLKHIAPSPKDQLHTEDQERGQKYHR